MNPAYTWQRFSHTVNGYEVAGGMSELGERARAVYDHWSREKSFTGVPDLELRLALFLSARAERHGGYPWEDTRREEAIVDELRRRHGEAWMLEQLAPRQR